MKIKNTINQKELELVLRLSEHFHITEDGWGYGRCVNKAIYILFPELHAELKDSELDQYHRDRVKAEFYAAICPDPVVEIMDPENYDEIRDFIDRTW